MMKIVTRCLVQIMFPKKDGGMGLRDPYSFNLAMLAKHCWRLIDEPDSLVACVLRAKYYPSGDIRSKQ